MLRVGFFSSQNYLSRTTFSGTLFSMYQALRAQDIHLVELGWPIQPGLGDRIRRRLDICQPLSPDTPLRSRAFAALVKAQLRLHPCDVLFAPVASTCLAAVETTTPVVYSSDTTFALYRQYYKIDATPAIQARLELEERAAIHRAARLLYPSRWAARSAVEDYGANPDLIDVAPYGANIAEPPPFERTVARLSTIAKDACWLKTCRPISWR